jgi:hypothetical protein
MSSPTTTNNNKPGAGETGAAGGERRGVLGAPTAAAAAAAVAAATTNNQSNNRKAVVFPVGRAGKNELRRALRGAASNPQRTIETFQRQHSLHSMMCKAFGKQPRPSDQSTTAQTTTTRASAKAATVQNPSINVESLDTDSVMEFLSHLGVSQYEVHKRISDTLLKKLEDEIKRTSSSSSSQHQQQSLLDLLQNSWAYAVAMPELRPIVWAVLKQLGAKTPHDVLLELARRADANDNSTADTNMSNPPDNVNNNSNINKGRSMLKHAEIFRPLPILLKKLVWEADFYNLIPASTSTSNERQQEANNASSSTSPTAYLEQARNTLWYQTIAPTLQQYCQNKSLVEAANRMLGVGPRERKMVTPHRRALTTTTTTMASAATAAATTAGTTPAATTAASSAGTTTTTTTALLREATGAAAATAAASSSSMAAAASASDPPSGKAIAQLRVYLSDKGGSSSSSSSRNISGSSSSYRPKLLVRTLFYRALNSTGKNRFERLYTTRSLVVFAYILMNE